MMRRLKKSQKLPQKTGREDVPQSMKRSNEAERRQGEGKNAGRKTGRPKAVNQDGPDLSPPKPTGCCHQKLDTLREDCGIIRKQASTDGGVLWKVVCVNVVQVRRKDRSLRDPREARSRVKV
ncbi:hypothetical protein TNCV_852251 [Trichonephila clavipes]|nr:hypothetical protein TNCV_852251 [Trichonephila clavipes]